MKTSIPTACTRTLLHKVWFTGSLLVLLLSSSETNAWTWEEMPPRVQSQLVRQSPPLKLETDADIELGTEEPAALWDWESMPPGASEEAEVE